MYYIAPWSIHSNHPLSNSLWYFGDVEVLVTILSMNLLARRANVLKYVAEKFSSSKGKQLREQDGDSACSLYTVQFRGAYNVSIMSLSIILKQAPYSKV